MQQLSENKQVHSQDLILINLKENLWLSHFGHLQCCNCTGTSYMWIIHYQLILNLVAGVCHPWKWPPDLPTGPDKAGGVFVHVPVEPRRRGRACSHVVFPSPLWGGWYPQCCWRGPRTDNTAQLLNVQRAGLSQQHDGHRQVGHWGYSKLSSINSLHFPNVKFGTTFKEKMTTRWK